MHSELLSEISYYTGIPAPKLCEKKRAVREVMFVRVAASTILFPKLSNNMIAQIFNKDHSSINHYRKQHEAWMRYGDYKAVYESLLPISQLFTGNEKQVSPNPNKK